jgi:hypothetical protein
MSKPSMRCAYFCVSWRDIEARIIAHVFIYEKIIKTWSSRRAVTVSSALVPNAKLGLGPPARRHRHEAPLHTPRRITPERSRCPNQNDKIRQCPPKLVLATMTAAAPIDQPHCAPLWSRRSSRASWRRTTCRAPSLVLSRVARTSKMLWWRAGK